MHLFVTGASGWIGSAVVTELLQSGHDVTGLARSDASAAAVAAAGATAVRGSLADLDVLRSAAEQSDGVVHLAFRHDIAFSGDAAGAVAADRGAIDTLGEALAGSDRPLAIASGVAGLKPGGIGTERDMPQPFPGVGGRALNERAALALVERGVRSMTIRFAPTVHGDGDGGFMAAVVAADRAAGSAGYIGDGSNRWPAVHRSDAARLVRLGIERAPAGTVLHAVGEEGVGLRDVAETIGRRLGISAESIDQREAEQRFGFLAGFLALDTPVSSTLTQQLLSWQPTGPTLLEDLGADHYYAAAAGSSA